MNRLLVIVVSSLKWSIVGVIRFYRWFISPLFGPKCRYVPTCSCYALDALKGHTFLKALGLIIRRVSSCHRWSKRNPYDPVPKVIRKDM